MANLIKPDGTSVEVKPAGTKWRLEELQKHVGGNIEFMPGVAGPKIVMNEEAALRGLPVNATATRIVLECLVGKVLRYQPVLRGDVLFLAPGESV